MPDLAQIRENDHQRGHPEAAINIVIYADFTHPDMIPLENMLQTLLEQAGDAVLVVYRHFPQTVKHPLAYATAQALEAAGQQGKFWEMLDQVLDNQATLSDGILRQLAREIGLDVAQFEDDMADVSLMRRIDADIQSGKVAQIHDTPAIFINGKNHQTLSLSTIQELIRNNRNNTT